MATTQQLIVIVDDDDGVRRALQRWLIASGFRTRGFDSAEALLMADGARDADCLVLDVRLPGASGTELYARLGKDRPPAVFITSHDSVQIRGAVAALGGAALLPKPFLAQQLTDASTDATRPRAP
jgi:FixJ family two-component response regulator